MSDGTPNQPPGQRRVVVLREGPPKGRGRMLDGVLGALGVVLLLVAVVLASVLPEETVPDPQYQVEYEEHLVEDLTSIRSADLLPGGILLEGKDNAFLVPVEVEHNNVFEVVGRFYFQEDREETLPDVFLVELLDPDGNVVQRSNPQPTLATCDVQEETGEPYTTPGQYYQTCEGKLGQEARIAFNLGGKPQPRRVTIADGENATLEEATQAIVQEDTVPTAGTWHLRLWLEEVGQCPATDPTELGIPSQSQQQRATLCRLAVEQENGGPGGVDDPGNPFVVNTEYRYYTIQVSEA